MWFFIDHLKRPWKMAFVPARFVILWFPPIRFLPPFTGQFNWSKRQRGEKFQIIIYEQKELALIWSGRWFKKHYGTTFHVFQRMALVNTALQELKAGKKTTDIAFESGYESLSGFGYTYKKLLGQSPANSNRQSVLLVHRFSSPLGSIFISASEQGICSLTFTDPGLLGQELRELQERLGAEILIGENDHTRQGVKELQEYFAGKRSVFEVPLHILGTIFQKKVWATLSELTFGTVVTYQELASKMKAPKSIGAVAKANAQNRIALLIPCHRLVNKHGILRGYSGGPERKKWLIDFERQSDIEQ